MQRNRRAALCFGDGFGFKITITRRFPANAMVAVDRSATTFDDYLVGNHEAAVETDAELTYQTGQVSAFVFCCFLQKCLRTGFGDGAKMLDRLLFRETDTIVGNRQGFRFFIDIDANTEFVIASQ